MMHMIEPHSLTKTGVPLKLTSMSMDIKERDSTATVTLDDRADMSVRDITKMWFYDDDTPGKNLVWRARSLNEAYHTKTPVIQLEHIISTLKDTILFKEITPATITGNKDAKTVSAKDTIKYLLKQQTTADWTLSAFECTDVSQGYSFEGETIFDALVTVSSTLEDCWWEYSTNSYPFKLYIRKLSNAKGAMMRAGRNLKTISKKTDKSGMYTRFYPVGKDDLHLTDGTLNSGKKPAHDYANRNSNTYGVIEHTETDTSKETVQELWDWADERLRLHAKPVTTLEVEGLELSSATGETMDKFTIGQMCEIVVNGKVTNARIIEKSYPDKVNSPENVRITLSDKRDDVAKIIAQDRKKQAKSSRVSARQSKQTREILYNTVKEVKIDGPDKSNKYTLQFKLVKDVDWQSAGTFSRAVTSWSVSSSGDAVKVTAQPQNQTKSVRLRGGTGSWKGTTYTGKIQYLGDDGKTWSNTEAEYSVDATEVTRTVNLADPSWTKAPSKVITGNSNTVTVSTTGRSPNVSKSVDLFITHGDWSDGKRYVYINQGDSTEDNRVARWEVDASLNDPSWTTTPSSGITGNSNTVTVSSVTGQSKSVNLYMTRGEWDSGQRYVYVNQGDSTEDNRVARINIDARLNAPSWTRDPSSSITGNSNTVTVSSKTGESVDIPLYLTHGDWENGQRYVYINQADSTDDNRVARWQVDARLNDPTWDRDPSSSITGNSNTVTVSSKTGQEKSVALYLTSGSWSSGQKYIYITHTDSQDAHRVARINVDARLNDPSWATTPSSDITGNSNTVTVSSKTSQEKSIALYMNSDSWSGGSKYVYVCHTDSQDAHRVARLSVSIPNPTDLSNITTYGNTSPTGGFSFGQLSKSGLTAGKYMSMTAKFGGKTFTFYFQVIA